MGHGWGVFVAILACVGHAATRLGGEGRLLPGPLLSGRVQPGRAWRRAGDPRSYWLGGSNRGPGLTPGFLGRTRVLAGLGCLR